MSVINTNVNSLVAQNALRSNGNSLAKAMEQLSSGKRINSAADDAAGLAISNKMTSEIRGLNQAIRNANDGISLLQTAEGGLVEITNMMQRMRELAVQSANDTNNDATDRAYLDLEFQQLKDEISRTIDTVEWNGNKLLDGTGGNSSDGEFIFHVGAGSGSTYQISHTIDDFDYGTATMSAAIATTATSSVQTSTLTIAGTVTDGDVFTITVNGSQFQYTVDGETTLTAVAANIQGSMSSSIGDIAVSPAGDEITFEGGGDDLTFDISVDVSNGELGSISALVVTGQGTAETAISSLDTAMDTVNEARANLGAVINRLSSTVNNLSNMSQNTAASRSRILDTDYAAATTELARTQIIQQAATAMLAQANQLPQTVLSLLK